MSKDFEKRLDATPAVRALRKEMFTQLAEAGEEIARTASDPKRRAIAREQAQRNREQAQYWD